MTEHNWILSDNSYYIHLYKCTTCFIIKKIFYKSKHEINYEVFYNKDYTLYIDIEEPSCDEMLITNILL